MQISEGNLSSRGNYKYKNLTESGSHVVKERGGEGHYGPQNGQERLSKTESEARSHVRGNGLCRA